MTDGERLRRGDRWALRVLGGIGLIVGLAVVAAFPKDTRHWALVIPLTDTGLDLSAPVSTWKEERSFATEKAARTSGVGISRRRARHSPKTATSAAACESRSMRPGMRGVSS